MKPYKTYIGNLKVTDEKEFSGFINRKVKRKFDYTGT